MAKSGWANEREHFLFARAAGLQPSCYPGREPFDGSRPNGGGQFGGGQYGGFRRGIDEETLKQVTFHWQLETAPTTTRSRPASAGLKSAQADFMQLLLRF